MALNRSPVRSDIGYLSRRRKPAGQTEPARPAAHEAAPAIHPAAATAAAPAPAPAVSGGLTLGRPAAALAPRPAAAAPAPAVSGGLTLGRPAAAPAPRPAAATPVSGGLTLGRPGAAPAAGPRAATTAPARPGPAGPGRLFPAPDFGHLRELDDANPVTRLNARQSAIGSLLVVGARSVTWEDEQLTTGARDALGQTAGTAVSTPGNRPLAGLQDGSGIVSLRHVRLLRRALFVAGDTPLTVGVFDGAATAVAARNDAGMRGVLYVARVGAVLEIRTEFVPADAPDAAIWAMFGFTMTIPLGQRGLQR